MQPWKTILRKVVHHFGTFPTSQEVEDALTWGKFKVLGCIVLVAIALRSPDKSNRSKCRAVSSFRR